MRPTRILLITLIALAFPLALGAAVYATAGRSLASPPQSLVTVSSNPVAQPSTTTDEPEDISGPCDEAEHRNDPRCASGAAGTEQDDRGDDHRGRGDDRRGDDDSGRHSRGSDDDRSGNSGSGSTSSGRSGSDDSGSHSGGSDDSGHSGGSDDSGSHSGGSDDSGSSHGGDD